VFEQQNISLLQLILQISLITLMPQHFRINKKKIKNGTNEHVNNIKLDPQHSVISDHILELDHSIDWITIKILDFEPFIIKD